MIKIHYFFKKEDERICRQRNTALEIELMVKYEGYIARQRLQVSRASHLEKTVIPRDIDYD
ncbi:hypothetical protein II654_01215, partial [bacterium]|nr:hypothetical protein [bacterium]